MVIKRKVTGVPSQPVDESEEDPKKAEAESFIPDVEKNGAKDSKETKENKNKERKESRLNGTEAQIGSPAF